MDMFINTIILDTKNIKWRYAYCLRETIKINPSYTLRIFTLNSSVVKDIIANSKFAQELLSLEDFSQKYNILFEFLKLNLMEKYQGVWIESDMIAKLYDFDPKYSYLMSEYCGEFELLTFNTWGAIHISPSDEFIKKQLRTLISHWEKDSFIKYIKIHRSWNFGTLGKEAYALSFQSRLLNPYYTETWEEYLQAPIKREEIGIVDHVAEYVFNDKNLSEDDKIRQDRFKNKYLLYKCVLLDKDTPVRIKESFIPSFSQIAIFKNCGIQKYFED